MFVRRIIPCCFLMLAACEDVETTPAQTYHEVPRNESQLRQDRLYSTIMRADDLSSSQQKTDVVGSLGLAEGHAPETAIPALLIALGRSETNDTVTQREIIHALGSTRSDLAVPILAHHLLKSGDRSAEGNYTPKDNAVLNAPVRKEAAISLGLIANKAGVDPLIDALLDSELTVRQAAQKSLHLITNQQLGYDSSDSFEQRVITQSKWKSWWEENQNDSRSSWLIEGFQQKKIDLEDLSSPESLVALVNALQKGEEFVRFNAADILAGVDYDNDNDRNKATEALVDLFDHELSSVRSTAVVTVIRLHGLSGLVPDKNGNLSLRNSIQYLPTMDVESESARLDETIAYVRTWWQNRSKAGSSKDAEDSPGDS